MLSGAQSPFAVPQNQAPVVAPILPAAAAAPKLPAQADPTPPASVKLDAVYKPILRKFRSYLREKFDQSQKKKGYVHWTTDRYIHQVRAFMVRDLNLPSALLDSASIAKMLTLVFPCTIKRPLPKLT